MRGLNDMEMEDGFRMREGFLYGNSRVGFWRIKTEGSIMVGNATEVGFLMAQSLMVKEIYNDLNQDKPS